MEIRKLLDNCFKNKLIVYLFSRYATYFLQFITSIYLANKLGPKYFGVWGFMLLLISYFTSCNFGLHNSISVLLVQNKSNVKYQDKLIKNDLLLVSLLAVLFLSIYAIFIATGSSWFEKYGIKFEFLIICLIGGIGLLDINLFSIYRTKNDYLKIAFNQSIVPVLVFILIFIFSGKDLLYALLFSSLMGSLCSLCVFWYKKPFSLREQIELNTSKIILQKGFWLFLYNLFFNFILISTRTFISHFYPVEDFGRFSFAFTLGDSALLLFQAIANVVFPKVLDKLNLSNGEKQTINNLKKVETSYVVMLYFCIYIIIALFPLIIQLFPKYIDSLQGVIFVSLTMVMYTNSFPYTSYLMSNNKERLLMVISLTCLIINIFSVLFIIKVLNLGYQYVILSTLIGYFLFYLISVWKTEKNLRLRHFSLVNFRLLAPVLLGLFICSMKFYYLLILPFILFLILNRQDVKHSFYTAKALLYNYKIVDL